jgi:hypothetical protein
MMTQKNSPFDWWTNFQVLQARRLKKNSEFIIVYIEMCYVFIIIFLNGKNSHQT